jgi:ABC-type branched-subunit amino acid transport system substrate-binding protein
MRNAVSLLILVVLSLTACGGTSGGGGGVTGTYSLGFTGDLSTQNSFLGKGYRDGAKAYIDYLNKNGGANGHQVNFTVLDDSNQSDRALANVTQLVTQYEAKAILGLYNTALCAAAAPLAAQYTTPLICGNASTALVDPPQPYLFLNTTVAINQTRPIMQFAASIVKAQNAKVGILSGTSTSYAALVQNLTAASATKGWQVVDTEVVSNTANDVSTQFAKIQSKSPDILILVNGNLAWLTQIMRKLEADKVNIPVLQTEGIDWTTLSQINNPNLNILAIFPYVSSSPKGAGVVAYANATKAAGVDPNGASVGRGYLEAMIAVAGLKKCGFPCSSQQLAQALEKINVPTEGFLSGNLAFTPSDHSAVHSMTFYQWDSSKSAPKAASEQIQLGPS